MIHHVPRILLLVLLIFLLFSPAMAEVADDRSVVHKEAAAGGKRVALVIGNSSYKDNPLTNPANDATDMAALLRQLGFAVELKVNAGKREMKEAMIVFSRSLQQSEIGLFYYAGHGLQVDNNNFLIPVDAEVHSESDVEYEALDAGRILGKMKEAGNKLNIVVLDACRNNPFARSFQRSSSLGLAQMNAPEGTIIAYATSPGSVAKDGEGRNSPYTSALLRNFQKPGMNIQDVFNATGMEVISASGKQQVPWMSSTPVPPFSLAGAGNPSGTATAPIAPPPPVAASGGGAQSDRETVFWESIKESKDAQDYSDYLGQFPNGTFAALAKRRMDALQRAALEEQQAAAEEARAAAEEAQAALEKARAAEQNSTLQEALRLYLGIPGGRVDWPAARPLFEKAAAGNDPMARMWLASMYQVGDDGFRKDTDKAKQLAEPVWEQVQAIAAKGEAQSQFLVGRAYAEGLAVAKDDSDAVRWYRKAADQGYAPAQTNLGCMYLGGHGVSKDDAEAVRWFRKAADQGFALAQTNLGYVYEFGHGVSKDDAEAVRWYRKAADQGDAIAQTSLGWMYKKGRGVSKDTEQAKALYKKACDSGLEDGCGSLLLLQ